MDVSFVLLTWNSEKYIENCIISVAESLVGTGLTWEAFVVDNGSGDRTVSILGELESRYQKQIIPIYLEKNTGTTFSRNLALKQAAGRYICVMDSDMELHPDMISGLIRTLESDSRIGMVVPRLLYPSGALQKSTDVFPTVFTKIFRYLFLKLVEDRENTQPSPNAPFPVDYAISALWFIRRSAFERTGFLDENFFYAPEDVDYCVRVWKAGYRIVYDPRYTAVHHTQELSRGFRLNRSMLEHIKGLFYYFRKHRCFFRKIKRPL